MQSPWHRGLFVATCCLAGLLFCQPLTKAAQPALNPTHDLLSAIQMDWGGYLRAIGTATPVAEDSIYQPVDHDPFFDGQLEGRLKNHLDLGSRWRLETHYELVYSGGDTRQRSQELVDTLPSALASSLSLSRPIDDDRRLFDLTHVLSENDRCLVYHRLDRLNLTWTPDWGSLRLGRQALTWGDGLIFNPMDLFNPFAPTSVQRDYKTGDDMALLQIPFGESEVQMLYLPRRDPRTGDVEDNATSYATKYHAFAGELEMTGMAARHDGDLVAGAGASGNLSEAAWRFNALYTHLPQESAQNDFLQIVTNLDYAWVWDGRNVYGFLEFYYNGLGSTGDYAETLNNDDLMDRLARGELFTIGRYYLAGQLQVELHPLVNLQGTAIVNLSDASGILQPQVQWDILSDLELIAGAQIYWGADDSEFGGFDISTAGATIDTVPSDQFYVWLTYYF